MSHFYRLSALKLASDIELPELLPWDGPPDDPVELSFRLGPVSEPDMSDHIDASSGAKACERYFAAYPDEARVLIENGRTVTLEPAPGADLTEARAILMAPVQAVLWHQRGLLPLHASVVGRNGRAVALAGPSGAGKSTLAAVLADKGFDVLADDICIVDAANGADLLPSTPRLRLWRDALDHLGICPEGLPRALSRREKYVFELGAREIAARWTLTSVVLLSRQPGAVPAMERLRGAHAVIELQNVVHMLPAARALGLEPAIFTALTSLMASGLAISRLVMPDDHAGLAVAAASVAALLDG